MSGVDKWPTFVATGIADHGTFGMIAMERLHSSLATHEVHKSTWESLALANHSNTFQEVRLAMHGWLSNAGEPRVAQMAKAWLSALHA